MKYAPWLVIGFLFGVLGTMQFCRGMEKQYVRNLVTQVAACQDQNTQHCEKVIKEYQLYLDEEKEHGRK
jgi:hypothetical protein